MHNIKQLLWIVMAVIGAFAFASCSDRNRMRGPGDGTSNDALLDITVTPDVPNPEHDIASLRMLVFDAQDKSLITNTKFDPATVYNPDSKSYLLSARIRSASAVRVLVIANERANWFVDQIITYDGVKRLEADYYDKINDLSDVTTPFLMLASTDQDIPTPPASNIERSMSLVRNVVKVSVSVKQKLITPQGDVALTFKKASIERVPKKGFLFEGNTYNAAEGFTQTEAFDLEAIGSTVDPVQGFSKLDQELTFYIPEHILTDKTKYTRLLITATKNATGSAVTYEIPLGNGVQKLYDPTPITKDQLTTTDLSAVRNTHFVIDATVGIVDISTSFKVKEWIEKEIQGEITAPYLNISSINEDVKISTISQSGQDIVTFDRNELVFLVWTNLGKENLILNTTVQRDFDAPVPLTEVFEYKWVVTEAVGGFLPDVSTATGKLVLKFKNPSKIWAQYKLKVSAKNLSRSIVINTNYLDISPKEANVTIKTVNGKLVCEPAEIEFKLSTNVSKEQLTYIKYVYRDNSTYGSSIFNIFTSTWTVTERTDPSLVFEAPVTGTLKLKFIYINKSTTLYEMRAFAKDVSSKFGIRANFQ